MKAPDGLKCMSFPRVESDTRRNPTSSTRIPVGDVHLGEQGTKFICKIMQGDKLVLKGGGDKKIFFGERFDFKLDEATIPN